jgi:DNA-binding phage protein
MNKKKLEKYTVPANLEENILNNLTSDKDIAEWLQISIEEFMEDGDADHFYQCVEYAVKARNLLHSTYAKTDISNNNIYATFKQPQLKSTEY